MEDKIGLSEMVAALRHELTTAQKEGKEETLRFTIEDVELELQIATEKSGKVGSGLKFWVVDSSLEVAGKKVFTQKLRLKLKVTDKANKDPLKPAEMKGVVPRKI